MQLSIDTSVETDLEVLIPDSYVNVPSEKIRLYRELDNITTEKDLDIFAKRLQDRFGAPIPRQTEELMSIVSLRLKAATLGIERIVLKNSRMTAYFVADRNHPFFAGDTFMTILQKLSTLRQFQLEETSGKLHIRTQNINSVEDALKAINLFLV